MVIKLIKKNIVAGLIGSLFAAAGVSHFLSPNFFEAIVPRWIPSPSLANQISGALEIALGCALLVPATRRKAAWGLIVLLVIVFPANIDMFVNNVKVSSGNGENIRVEGAPDVWVRNLARLPLQFVLAYLLYRQARPKSSRLPVGP